MNAWMPNASSTAITMIAASSNSELAVDFDFLAPLLELTAVAGPPGVPGRAKLAPFCGIVRSPEPSEITHAGASPAGCSPPASGASA